MSELFILIPGRTAKQGCGISEGKFGETYLTETSRLQVAPADMQRLDLADGHAHQQRLGRESGKALNQVCKPRFASLIASAWKG
ncbi:MAG: hypothetical protein NTY19_40140 [Planctomycetota bacterium]|nr:hypothetical protein [Planctomycetota bacterium]